MGFTRKEYWSGLPFLPPGDLFNPGIKPVYPALAEGFFTIEPPRKPLYITDVPKRQIYRDIVETQSSLLGAENGNIEWLKMSTRNSSGTVEIF